MEPVMHKIWLSWETCGKLLVNYFTHPDSLLAYSVEGLRLDVPTLYMYTRSGPGGKLADPKLRIEYFSRHVDTVREFDELVAKRGYHDGVTATDRQLIWIVVEDNAQIEPQLAEYLKNTSIRKQSWLLANWSDSDLTTLVYFTAYIYFAHGPTNWLGVAQWNAVDRAVDVLRNTFYADGPVINVDDDSRILPELLRRVWRVRARASLAIGCCYHWKADTSVLQVKRAITWPVGNLGPQCKLVYLTGAVLPADSLYLTGEGLMCKNGKQDYWRLGGLPERIFPLE
jgi:hypothetical protein